MGTRTQWLCGSCSKVVRGDTASAPGPPLASAKHGGDTFCPELWQGCFSSRRTPEHLSVLKKEAFTLGVEALA